MSTLRKNTLAEPAADPVATALAALRAASPDQAIAQALAAFDAAVDIKRSEVLEAIIPRATLTPVSPSALEDFHRLGRGYSYQGTIPALIRLHRAAVAGAYQDLATAARSLRASTLVESAADGFASMVDFHARRAESKRHVQAWEDAIVSHVREDFPELAAIILEELPARRAEATALAEAHEQRREERRAEAAIAVARQKRDQAATFFRAWPTRRFQFRAGTLPHGAQPASYTGTDLAERIESVDRPDLDPFVPHVVAHYEQLQALGQGRARS